MGNLLKSLPLVSDVIGGIFDSANVNKTNNTNWDIAKLNNETQYKMFQEQMSYNTKEREETQKYNSPENQRMLYEQAGINPYAMVGNMNPQTVAQSAPAAPSMQVPEVRPNMAMGAMFRNLGNDIKVALENEQLGLDNETKRIELSYKTQEKILDLQEKRANIASKKTQTDYDKKNIEYIDKQISLLSENLDVLRSTKPEIKKQAQLETKSKELENDAKRLSNQYQEWQNDYAKSHGQKELSLLDAKIKESLSASALNGAMSAKAMAEKAIVDVEKEGVKLDNDEKKRLRGHVLKMARLAEQEVELKNELTKYETGVNGRDWLRAGTSILNGIGTAAVGYAVGRGAKVNPNVQSVKAVPRVPTIMY